MYPELVSARDKIHSVIAEEEASFSRTLVKGIERFKKLAASAQVGLSDTELHRADPSAASPEALLTQQSTGQRTDFLKNCLLHGLPGVPICAVFTCQIVHAALQSLRASATPPVNSPSVSSAMPTASAMDAIVTQCLVDCLAVPAGWHDLWPRRVPAVGHLWLPS